MVDFETIDVPAEMWVVLCAPSGEPLDRSGWTSLFGEHPAIAGPIAAQVEGWLTSGEYTHVEFKETLGGEKVNRRFAQTIAAFANGAGGAILVGVTDEAQVVGYTRPKAKDQIADIIRNLVCEPISVTVEPVIVRGQTIHVVLVPPGDPTHKPYRCGGVVFVRTLGTTREATTSEIRRLSAEGTAASQ